MSKPKIGIVGFTGCAGCQLSILDLEDELLDLLSLVDIIDFRMAMTGNKEGPYDLLFVEGSIGNEEQKEKLIKLRKQADILVAIGACACFGGVQAIRNYKDNEQVKQAAYGKEGAKKIPEIKALPINKVVPVDHYLLECPVNKYDFLDFVKYFLVGGTPKLPNIPVCQQCKAKENRCLFLEDGIICMGPVIQAGCGALCPSHNMPCDGCRGSTMEAAYKQQVELMMDKGASEEDVTRYLLKYAGEDPQIRDFLLKAWKEHDKTITYQEESK
ncbi:MAG: oxidoreductase [Candidatus Heimdallarchaeota archaeon]|nr:oxidoreductase [Candidatus Heimdallarchaeota archaeon]